jgi:hypothetical protein
MTTARELNARQRKCVYMHSTIFDTAGPNSKSIYEQGQQKKIYQGLADTMKPWAPPDLSLPNPSDIQCTQNAGHNVVIPSSVRPEALAGKPRISGQDALVEEGEVIPVVKAGGKDKAIPKEFWQTSVNLQWSDTRSEFCRQRDIKDRHMGAQELKLQELSSEIFGKERMTDVSTRNPGGELLSQEWDRLQTDSTNEPYVKHNQTRQLPSAHTRFCQNLGDSQENTMPLPKETGGYPKPVPQEDPSTLSRRRHEKNFSDLFDTRMGERKEVRGKREEVIGTANACFLDTRVEIGGRNKDHWKPNQAEVSGPYFKEPPNVSHLRKEAERDSMAVTFDPESPRLTKPRKGTEEVQVDNRERVCWDTKETFESNAEIARRTRVKDFENDLTARERKWNTLASQQMRHGFGGEFDYHQPQFSPDGKSVFVDRVLTEPKPRLANTVNATAKQKKLASLQSSVFP